MKTKPKTVKACLIIIGNEILTGRTRDANLVFLAENLNKIGVQLTETRIIRDNSDIIVETINAVRPKYDYVLTTGGIGPTHDDLTSASIAKAFGVELEKHPDAVKTLENYYGEQLNEARLKMAFVPKGAGLIANPISHAPGFYIENVYVMAGVPSVVRAMFDNIKHNFKGGEIMKSTTITCTLREGQVAQKLADIQTTHPEIEIGSYPFFHSDNFGVSIVLRGFETTKLDEAANAVKSLITDLGGTLKQA